MKSIALVLAVSCGVLAFGQNDNPFNGFTGIPALKGFHEVHHATPSWQNWPGQTVFFDKELRSADLRIYIWAAKYPSTQDIIKIHDFEWHSSDNMGQPLKKGWPLYGEGLNVVDYGGYRAGGLGSETDVDNVMVRVNIQGFKETGDPSYWDMRRDPTATDIFKRVILEARKRMKLIK